MHFRKHTNGHKHRADTYGYANNQHIETETQTINTEKRACKQPTHTNGYAHNQRIPTNMQTINAYKRTCTYSTHIHVCAYSTYKRACTHTYTSVIRLGFEHTCPFFLGNHFVDNGEGCQTLSNVFSETLSTNYLSQRTPWPTFATLAAPFVKTM